MIFDPRDFPGLYLEGYTKTSEADWGYNCIAWACEKDSRWWWPGGKAPDGKDSYWPSDVPKKTTIPAFVRLFTARGFKIVRDQNSDREPGFEKVAIYALGHEPKHAARQLPSGEWAHKMGREIDLVTAKLSAVEGNGYGRVVKILKRKIRAS